MRLRIFLRGVESRQAFQHSERIWKVGTWSSSFLSLWLFPHFFLMLDTTEMTIFGFWDLRGCSKDI